MIRPAKLAAFTAAAIAVATCGVRQVGAVVYHVSSTTSFTDFESFTVNDTINQYTDEALRGQTWSADDEWVGSPGSFDEEIVSTGGGNQGWRISAAQGSGGFSAKPWSPSVAAVGEPGSHLWNDRGSDHTSPLDPPNENGSPAYSRFSASFDFWSATGTTQDGMFMSISPGPRQSSFRQSYIGLDADDDTAGIDIGFYETVAGGSFQFHQVATNLDPSLAHNVRMDIAFYDGINGDGTGNDEVNVYVDGVLALTGVSTWETYYRNTSAFSDTPEVAVDSLLFNVTGSASGTSGGGFVFDNVQLAAVPEPATIAIWSLLAAAGIGLSITRRRRK